VFGQIDIYLFDQLLKGHFDPRMRVLDAGCGGGRNLVYFLRSGYDVCGVDLSTEAIAHARALASGLAPNLPADNFRVEAVEGMSFADTAFDVVIRSAVLHFARDGGALAWHGCGDVEGAEAGRRLLRPPGLQRGD
jgi:tellurite methyltransferase